MSDLLGYIVLLPFAGFLLLTFFGKSFGRKLSGFVGVGSVGLSAALAIFLGVKFIAGGAQPETVRFWQWFDVAGLRPDIAFYLDAMSLVFVFVITFVGFLIHLYSTEYMAGDEGFARFFAYMNLFVGSMLILVLADNLVLLYLGWEGVGLCSFLLIGFWYKEPENAAAAKKAFIVTRVGDTAMAIGLFLLFVHFNTLNIQEILVQAPEQWVVGATAATLVALLLLGGAVGKSAQLPLQTWLPDAMAGPTPVSALIHAATMVTAGVYLIARTHTIYMLSPAAMTTISVIGAATLLIAGFAAMAQYDIKKVLAYSTISQIGYMFLGLGIGAWSAAVFHFMIHGFFKALLFLGAGAVILAMHHEQNMFKMGGLRKRLPAVFWTYLIGSASLAALPLITAGFYSKDQILWYAWAGEQGGKLLWVAGIIGAAITAFYTFRMVFITFYGEERGRMSHAPGAAIKIPLVILAVFSLFGGFLDMPHNIAHFNPFSNFLSTALPPAAALTESVQLETLLQGASAVAALSGIFIAYWFYIKKPVAAVKTEESYRGLKRFFLLGWGFDWLYDKLFVRPLVFLAAINKNDFIDKIYAGIAGIHVNLNRALSATQTGNLRWYIMGLSFGAVAIIIIILLV